MKRALLGPLPVAAVAALAAVVAARTRVAADVLFASVLCVAACAAWWLLRIVRSESHALRTRFFTDGGRDRRAMQPCEQLDMLDRLIVNATFMSNDAYARLRPRLRSIACDLLASRRGIVVDPATADISVVLGAPGNALLGPLRRPLPHGPDRGPPLSDIALAIRLIEEI